MKKIGVLLVGTGAIVCIAGAILIYRGALHV